MPSCPLGRSSHHLGTPFPSSWGITSISGCGVGSGLCPREVGVVSGAHPHNLTVLGKDHLRCYFGFASAALDFRQLGASGVALAKWRCAQDILERICLWIQYIPVCVDVCCIKAEDGSCIAPFIFLWCFVRLWDQVRELLAAVCWETDPWNGLGSFGSSHERGSLSLPSLAPPINLSPSLPPVGSH